MLYARRLLDRFTRRSSSVREVVKKRKSAQRRARRGFEPLEERRVLSGGGLWISGGDAVYETNGAARFAIGYGGYESNVSVEYRTAAGSASNGDFDQVSGLLTFEPGASPVVVTVPVVDDSLTEGDETFYLELFNPVNDSIAVSQAAATIKLNDHAPVVDAIGDQMVDEETPLQVYVSATDRDEPAESLTFSLDAGAPSGATIDPQSGAFSWTPQEIDGPGVFQVTVRVTDNGTSPMSAAQSFTITVNEVNQAPTTSGLDGITVDEDSAGTTLDLRSAFDDVEDGACGLTFAVVANSDSSLFTTVTVNSAGQLALAYRPDAFGYASITVRATDTGGLFVETTFNVNVQPVDDAPVISGFSVTYKSQDTWAISGSVADIDDDVAGWAVYFGGVLASYSISASVDADGTFSVEVELPGLQSDVATAWVYDGSGLQSNVADVTV